MDVTNKALKLCRDLGLPGYGPECAKIVIALVAQDRDTRHACAEAVTKIDERNVGGYINKNDAHTACINAVAV